LLYVIHIGGDFMSGRFFSAPLIIATATLLRAPLERTQSLALGALFVIVGLSSPTPPPLSGVAAEGRTGSKVEVVRNRVVDERRYYHADTGLLTADRERAMPGGPYRDVLARAGERGIIVTKLGMRGFLARPDTVLIDGYGLTDPFLARMPYPPELIKSNWTVGHFKRPKPEGYVESVKSGENLLKDPKLARFYAQTQLITTGPLWSTARLRAIWRLNTGQYDAWTKGQAGSLEVEQDDDL
jgi:arabinofuranosyltransferase